MQQEEKKEVEPMSMIEEAHKAAERLEKANAEKKALLGDNTTA